MVVGVDAIHIRFLPHINNQLLELINATELHISLTLTTTYYYVDTEMTTDIGPQDIEMVDAEVIEDSIPIASDLPMARAEEPIFSLAWDCDDLIQECLKRTDTDSVPTQDTWREYERRFNAWWEHHGVFAKSIANLDRKLHRRPEIRDIVVRLLIILKRNLILGKFQNTAICGPFLFLMGLSKGVFDKRGGRIRFVA